MTHKSIFVSFFVLTLIVLGMFVYAHLKTVEKIDSVTYIDPAVDEQVQDYYNTLERIEGTHVYEDGEHTIVGEIPMPTPCDLLDWDVRVLESYPEQIIVDFKVVRHSDMCVQVVTAKEFVLSVSAGEHATFRATLERQEVEFVLHEAKGDALPNTHELYLYENE